MNFSVIKNNWIPVRYLKEDNLDSDCIKEISIKKVFEDAHKIKEICDENEMVNLGIYRLLIAFCMDMYNIKTSEDKDILLEAETFDIDIFDKYILGCEKNGNCFDLFDDIVPFLQTGCIKPDALLKPVSTISDFDTKGTETTFFGGKRADLYAFTPAECARKLCQKMTTVIKSKQGEGYLAFSPLQNAIFMLHKGESLKQTIIFNSLTQDEWEINGICPYYGNEKISGPAWRQGKQEDRGKEYVKPVESLLSMLTFMPVNIKLCPNEEDGLVHDTYYTPKTYKDKSLAKEDLKKDFIYRFEDPMVVIKSDKDKNTGELKRYVASIDPGVGLWETIDAFHAYSDKRNEIPLIIPEDKDAIIEIETWSPCKNANGKGVIFHQSFSLNPTIIEKMSKAEITEETTSFSEVISNVKVPIKKALKNQAFSEDIVKKKIIPEIQSKLRLYMNAVYFSIYIPKLNCIDLDKDPFGIDRYENEFWNETMDQFERIINNYMEKFPNSYNYIKAKQEMEKQLHLYFNSKKRNQEVL